MIFLSGGGVDYDADDGGHGLEGGTIQAEHHPPARSLPARGVATGRGLVEPLLPLMERTMPGGAVQIPASQSRHGRRAIGLGHGPRARAFQDVGGDASGGNAEAPEIVHAAQFAPRPAEQQRSGITHGTGVKTKRQASVLPELFAAHVVKPGVAGVGGHAKGNPGKPFHGRFPVGQGVSEGVGAIRLTTLHHGQHVRRRRAGRGHGHVDGQPAFGKQRNLPGEADGPALEQLHIHGPGQDHTPAGLFAARGLGRRRHRNGTRDESRSEQSRAAQKSPAIHIVIHLVGIHGERSAMVPGCTIAHRGTRPRAGPPQPYIHLFNRAFFGTTVKIPQSSPEQA